MKSIIFLIVIPGIILFVVLNLITRELFRRYQEVKEQREREDALAESLSLDFTRESETLQRVELDEPKARLLCVDDEAVILDSLRKILVLDGFSVDTVETGQEALGLVQMRDYDFVFTDLKMPSMSGTDVVKSVKHLRPDIDVVIITGFATVESAVECMKYGAMDYIEKPFTEDELTSFVRRALIKRQVRIEKQLKPRVHVLGPSGRHGAFRREFTIPGGVLVSTGHCWVSLAEDGTARIGMDDFANKLLGPVDSIEFPAVGTNVTAGETLFSIRQKDRRAEFKAPLSGQVVKTNQALRENAGMLENLPYGKNWICVVEAKDLDAELPGLHIGKSAISYFQEELDRFNVFLRQPGGDSVVYSDSLSIGALSRLDDNRWQAATRLFFGD